MSSLKSFRLLFAVAAFAAVTIGAAAAQEISPEHLALARKYVDMTDSAKVYEQSVIRTGLGATRTLIAQNPDLADPVTQTAIAVIKEYEDLKSELFDQFARIYAIHFNEAELGEIIAFYQTPVGQRLIAQLPAVNQELQLALQVYESNLSSEFMSKMRTRLAADGFNF